MATIKPRKRVTVRVRAAPGRGGSKAVQGPAVGRRILAAVDQAARRLPNRIATSRSLAARFAGRLPGVVGRARGGAAETATAMQTLRDPELRLVAAGSIGCAVGLYLAGAPRLVTLPALVPALVAGGAIMSRPGRVQRRT